VKRRLDPLSITTTKYTCSEEKKYIPQLFHPTLDPLFSEPVRFPDAGSRVSNKLWQIPLDLLINFVTIPVARTCRRYLYSTATIMSRVPFLLLAGAVRMDATR
jgi:hypothetical protein